MQLTIWDLTKSDRFFSSIHLLFSPFPYSCIYSQWCNSICCSPELSWVPSFPSTLCRASKGPAFFWLVSAAASWHTMNAGRPEGGLDLLGEGCTEWSDPTPSGKWGLKSCCCLLGNFSKCVLRQFFNYLVSPFPLFWRLVAWEQSLRNSLLLVLILSTPALFCQELLEYNTVILPWQPWFFSQPIFTVWPPPTMVTVQQERQHCVSLKEGSC